MHTVVINPDLHAVYILWGDDSVTPLYVGESSNVLGRLGDHLRHSGKRPHIRRVEIRQFNERATAWKIERDLIKELEPTWNRQGILSRHAGGRPRLMPLRVTGKP